MVGRFHIPPLSGEHRAVPAQPQMPFLELEQEASVGPDHESAQPAPVSHLPETLGHPAEADQARSPRQMTIPLLALPLVLFQA